MNTQSVYDFEKQVSKLDDLFTLSDFNYIMKVAKDKDDNAIPLAKRIIYKNIKRRYHIHVIKTENISVWKDGYFVSYGCALPDSGMGVPITIDSFLKYSYQDLKDIIFKALGIIIKNEQLSFL